MIRSREELKQYALRALGAPVIEVNVADEQLEDRLDDAIEYYNMYHYDGVERMYLKHLITDTNMTNKYIQLPDDIRGITRVFSLNAKAETRCCNCIPLEPFTKTALLFSNKEFNRSIASCQLSAVSIVIP